MVASAKSGASKANGIHNRISKYEVPQSAGSKAAAKGASRSQADEVPAELLARVDEINQRVGRLTEHNITERVDIGRQLLEIINDKTGRYGTNPQQALRRLMPLSQDGLRPMMVLASEFTEDEIRRLLALQNPKTHEKLTWSHLAILTRVKDKPRRMELAKKAVAEEMSSKELGGLVIKTHGGPKSAGGRKRKQAKTFSACLDDIEKLTRSWMNAADKVWGASGGLADLFAEARANHVLDSAAVERIGEVADVLDLLLVKVKGLSGQVSTLQIQAKAARAPRAVA